MPTTATKEAHLGQSPRETLRIMGGPRAEKRTSTNFSLYSGSLGLGRLDQGSWGHGDFQSFFDWFSQSLKIW